MLFTTFSYIPLGEKTIHYPSITTFLLCFPFSNNLDIWLVVSRYRTSLSQFRLAMSRNHNSMSRLGLPLSLKPTSVSPYHASVSQLGLAMSRDHPSVSRMGLAMSRNHTTASRVGLAIVIFRCYILIVNDELESYM